MRHKHRDRQIDRQRCFLVKWSSASRTQNSCRLCIKHLYFCFFPSTLCNGWSLYLLARDRMDSDLTKKRCGRVFRTVISTPKTPPLLEVKVLLSLILAVEVTSLCFLSLLQCWCFFSSPSLSAAICLTVFSQSFTHDDLYSFSL